VRCRARSRGSSSTTCRASGIGTAAGGVVLLRAARPEPIAAIHKLLEPPVKMHARNGRRVLVIYDEFQAPIALEGMGKQGFYAQVDLDQAKAYAYAVELMAASSQTPDAREGMAAFLEKARRASTVPGPPAQAAPASPPAAASDAWPNARLFFDLYAPALQRSRTRSRRSTASAISGSSRSADRGRVGTRACAARRGRPRRAGCGSRGRRRRGR
jgi:hypothetical protein